VKRYQTPPPGIRHRSAVRMRWEVIWNPKRSPTTVGYFPRPAGRSETEIERSRKR